MKIYIAAVYFLTVMLSSSFCYAKQVMTWYIISFEPAYITEGDKKGQGFVDVQLKLFIENMPQYKHEVRMANLSRIRKELQRTDILAGTPGQGGPTGRFGNDVLVSVPTIFIPPIGIAVRKNDLHRFKNGADISLNSDLFGNKDLRAAVIQGATERIHPSVAGLIDKNKDRVTILSNPNQEKFFELLLHGRIDYFFTYPFNFKVIVNRLNVTEKLAFISFKEQNEYRKVYAYFTHTPESAAVLKKINRIISNKEFREKSVGSLLNYVPDNIKNRVAKRNGLDWTTENE